MRILLGPLHLNDLSRFILRGFCDHDVRTFSTHEADVRYALPGASFSDVLDRLPPGWVPDLVVFLFPEFSCLLPGIEACPYPTVLLVSDWHASYDAVERVCAMFDVVVADRAGAERLRRTSDARVLARPLYGYDPEVHRRLDLAPAYDLSIVADLDPHVHHARTRYLVRLAQLGDRYRVQFFTNMVRDAYVQRVNQTRITFNYAVRGEMSMRCYEAPACGSLLFCERGNAEIGDYLEDGKECVLYGEDDIESLAARYLDDEALRRAVADAGHRRIQPFTYRHRMNALVAELADLQVGPRAFREREPGDRRAARARQAYCSWDVDAPRRAVLDAQIALRWSPDDATLLNTLGCAAASAADHVVDGEAGAAFRRLADEVFSDVHDLIGVLNHAHLLLSMGRLEDARRRLVEGLREGIDLGDTLYYPRRFDRFLCEWERRPEQRWRLAMWRVHDLLADLEPHLRERHLRAAVGHRPDLGSAWHRLALALPEAARERGECLRRALRCDALSLQVRHDLIRQLWPRERADALDLAEHTARTVSAFPFGDQECARITDLVDELSLHG